MADALHQLKGIESVSMILNKARRRSSDHVAYGYGYGYPAYGYGYGYGYPAYGGIGIRTGRVGIGIW